MKKFFILFSKVIMSLFYEKQYLTGKFFDNNIIGWKWCWQNFYFQKVKGYNRNYPFPVSFRSEFTNFKNISFDINDLNNFQHFGCYFQAWNGKIKIGKGTYIAPNVGIITENHKLNNLDEHDSPKDVKIGDNCWIGMNSVILPGVTLGNGVIVGAGSIVTKSFLDENIVICGNPAKVVKKYEKKD
ncbi:acyltransferase [Massilimicrobiota timonensis]|uniref:acyltransferase n=1 Tax=Massilimicrobiota timonensis TaxID=1776392 RepID=UPI001F5C5CF0|nr:acyltransferase [Massilimicrobiota timonensis]